VWSTGFFDKNVVGTANALAGGWGNAGGGITYFLMPAIFDSLVGDRGLTPHVAWRVAFIVPFIVITCTAGLMILLTPDTPTGRWADRHLAAQQNLQAHGVHATGIIDIPGNITDKKERSSSNAGVATPTSESDEKNLQQEAAIAVAKHTYDHEAQMGEKDMLETARGEIVVKPSMKEAMEVIFSLQTFMLGFCYFNSFGAELAINSILGSYYLKNFPSLGQTGTGQWAAMFGLLNVVFRPLGGIAGDLIYKYTKNLWLKKALIHFVGVVTGILLIIIGVTNPHDQSTSKLSLFAALSLMHRLTSSLKCSASLPSWLSFSNPATVPSTHSCRTCTLTPTASSPA
jgi:NNP family nitrate/nitrite transporter-like MFS transporter